MSTATTLPTTPSRSPGQIAYEAYGDRPGPHGPWKTFNGNDMPRWSELQGPTGELTRERWEVGVDAAIAALAQVPLVAGEAEEGTLDPFLAGLSEISGATRDLAAAKESITGLGTANVAAVDALIETVAAQLLARVKLLADSPTED